MARGLLRGGLGGRQQIAQPVVGRRCIGAARGFDPVDGGLYGVARGACGGILRRIAGDALESRGQGCAGFAQQFFRELARDAFGHPGRFDGRVLRCRWRWREPGSWCRDRGGRCDRHCAGRGN